MREDNRARLRGGGRAVEVGELVLYAFAHQAHARRPFFRAEEALDRVGPRPGRAGRERGPDRLAKLDVALAATLQRVVQSPQLAVADDTRELGGDCVFGGVGADLERLPQRDFQHAQPIGRIAAFEAHRLLDPRSQAKRAAQQLVETLLGGVADRGRKGASLEGRLVARCQRQHGVDRLALQRVGGRLVEDGEARRHVGFQREALQQALAERVDGLHLEPARRLDGGREQGARALDLRRRRLAGGELGEDVCELCLVHGHPLRQRVVDALRHLGRSGLGVGKGEDALGYGAGQHKAQRAQREHVRLAGAGVGAHPSGCRRICRVALGLVGAFEVGSVRRHGSTSSSSATAHSATRARCA